MFRTLVIDNHDSFTYNLVMQLERLTLSRPVVVLGDTSVERFLSGSGFGLTEHLIHNYDLVVISPGPGHPEFDVGDLCRTITSLYAVENIDPRMPAFLGVCLGHQLYLALMGYSIRRHTPAHGIISKVRVLADPNKLFSLSDSSGELEVVRYHSLIAVPSKGAKVPSKNAKVSSGLGSCLIQSLVVEEELDGQRAEILMGTQRTDFPLLTVQFHPESVRTLCGDSILGNFVRHGMEFRRKQCSRELGPVSEGWVIEPSNSLVGVSVDVRSETPTNVMGETPTIVMGETPSTIGSISLRSSPHLGSGSSTSTGPSCVTGPRCVLRDSRALPPGPISCIHICRVLDRIYVQRRAEQARRSQVKLERVSEEIPQESLWMFTARDRNTVVIGLGSTQDASNLSQVNLNSSRAGSNQETWELDNAWLRCVDSTLSSIFDLETAHHSTRVTEISSIAASSTPMGVGLPLVMSLASYEAQLPYGRKMEQDAPVLEKSEGELPSHLTESLEFAVIVTGGPSTSGSNLDPRQVITGPVVFECLPTFSGFHELVDEVMLALGNQSLGSGEPCIDLKPPSVTLSLERSRDSYLAAVDSCKEHLFAGDAYQLCLTSKVKGSISSAAENSPIDVFASMPHAPNGFLVHHIGYPLQVVPRGSTAQVSKSSASLIESQPLVDVYICSSSPERFAKVDGTKVEVRPMKGTKAKFVKAPSDRVSSDQVSSDQVSSNRTSLSQTSSSLEANSLSEVSLDEAKAYFLGSSKELAENMMIVDLMRNDLSRVCSNVVTPHLFEVEQYPHYFQLVSRVEGNLTLRDEDKLAFPAILSSNDKGRTQVFQWSSAVTRLMRALFPPGSMTGAPKESAVKILSRIEREAEGRGVGSRARGLGYSGVFGWMQPLARTTPKSSHETSTTRTSDGQLIQSSLDCSPGRADFAVVIRTAVFVKQRKPNIVEEPDDYTPPGYCDFSVSYGVGGAILCSSSPEQEYEEALLKALPLLTAVDKWLKQMKSSSLALDDGLSKVLASCRLAEVRMFKSSLNESSVQPTERGPQRFGLWTKWMMPTTQSSLPGTQSSLPKSSPNLLLVSGLGIGDPYTSMRLRVRYIMEPGDDQKSWRVRIHSVSVLLWYLHRRRLADGGITEPMLDDLMARILVDKISELEQSFAQAGMAHGHCSVSVEDSQSNGLKSALRTEECMSRINAVFSVGLPRLAFSGLYSAAFPSWKSEAASISLESRDVVSEMSDDPCTYEGSLIVHSVDLKARLGIARRKSGSKPPRPVLEVCKSASLKIGLASVVQMGELRNLQGEHRGSTGENLGARGGVMRSKNEEKESTGLSAACLEPLEVTPKYICECCVADVFVGGDPICSNSEFSDSKLRIRRLVYSRGSRSKVVPLCALYCFDFEGVKYVAEHGIGNIAVFDPSVNRWLTPRSVLVAHHESLPRSFLSDLFVSGVMRRALLNAGQIFEADLLSSVFTLESVVEAAQAGRLIAFNAVRGIWPIQDISQ